MRKIALIICAAMMIASTTLRAQEVKPIEASIEDYIALLNQNGYQAYSFDISPMKDTTYQVQFEVREYVADNPNPVSVQPYGRGLKNRTMVKDFMWRELSEEEVAEIKAASVDYENGVYSRSEKITVGFLPCENDSTKVACVFLDNQGNFRFSLKLKPINHSGAFDDHIMYQYRAMPFKASVFEDGKFIPLAAYTSFWFDAQYKIIRSCGATELDPDFSTEILDYIPHYTTVPFKLINTE